MNSACFFLIRCFGFVGGGGGGALDGENTSFSDSENPEIACSVQSDLDLHSLRKAIQLFLATLWLVNKSSVGPFIYTEFDDYSG